LPNQLEPHTDYLSNVMGQTSLEPITLDKFYLYSDRLDSLDLATLCYPFKGQNGFQVGSYYFKIFCETLL